MSDRPINPDSQEVSHEAASAYQRLSRPARHRSCRDGTELELRLGDEPGRKEPDHQPRVEQWNVAEQPEWHVQHVASVPAGRHGDEQHRQHHGLVELEPVDGVERQQHRRFGGQHRFDDRHRVLDGQRLERLARRQLLGPRLELGRDRHVVQRERLLICL
jgi:hypothetical protein